MKTVSQGERTRGKRVELKHALNNKDNNFMRSYTGRNVACKSITIGIYDKHCASASCIEICMSETTESKNGNYREHNISYVLNKEQLVELRDVLNEAEL